MNQYFLLSLFAALVAGGTGVLVWFKGPKGVMGRSFLWGSVSVFWIESCAALIFFSSQPRETLLFSRLSLLGLCFLPGNWTLFSLSFARRDYGQYLKRWGWYIVLLYLAGCFFLTFSFSERFLALAYIPGEGLSFLFGGIGKFFLIFLLLSSVVILVNLENTFMSLTSDSKGKMAVPLLALMIGFLFLVWSSSEMLLYSRLSLSSMLIGSILVFIEGLGFLYFSLKQKILQTNIYVGREFVYSSALMFTVGLYLLGAGIAGKLVGSLGGNVKIYTSILASFAFIAALIFLLLSSSLKERIKGFVDRNFYREKYDYRREWSRFSQELSSIIDLDKLVRVIGKTTSQLIDVREMAVLLPQKNGDFEFFWGLNSENEGVRILQDNKFLDWILRYGKPVDLMQIEEPYKDVMEDFQRLGTAVLVPLISKRELVAIFSLGEKKEGYSKEDMEILETIADHSAMAILNARLNQNLVATKQLESFHKLSSFIIHDLKNSVSTLSLLVRNANLHLQDPDFQKSMLRTVTQAVEKMNSLMGKLRTVSQSGKISQGPVDLNSLVEEILSKLRLEEKKGIEVEKHLNGIPLVKGDAELLEKVVLNLVLNGIEAMPQGGSLRLYTSKPPRGRRAELRVSDTGVGMSKGFIRNSLFKPFQTSKGKGLGLGLYQSKEIVEAHGGRIEVESKEGEGTTFTIKLGLWEEKDG